VLLEPPLGWTYDQAKLFLYRICQQGLIRKVRDRYWQVIPDMVGDIEREQYDETPETSRNPETSETVKPPLNGFNDDETPETPRNRETPETVKPPLHADIEQGRCTLSGIALAAVATDAS
jgi:hypothetical protein